MRSAVRSAIARVCASSDSRTPCCRPSTAGRIPIFGQSPTKRPLVFTVGISDPLRLGRRGRSRRPARARIVGRHDTDGEQQVGIDPRSPVAIAQGDVGRAARRRRTSNRASGAQLEAGQQPRNSAKTGGSSPVVRAS